MANQAYLYKPDVKIEGTVHSPGVGQNIDYQWSKDYRPEQVYLDQIRCDTNTTWGESGCVFLNSAPTYAFNDRAVPVLPRGDHRLDQRPLFVR